MSRRRRPADAAAAPAVTVGAGDVAGRAVNDLIVELATLRSVREEQLPESADEIRRLVHELRVHQVELEIQNQQLREAQGQLEESRGRYVELYDRAPVGYVSVDRGGSIKEINLTAASMLETERARLLGRKLRFHMTRDSRQRFDAALARGFDEGARVTTEIVLASEKRTERVVELWSVPLPDPRGGVTACEIAMSDVTARRLAERERADLLAREQAARAVAEQASRVKEDFLAIVSHELRTPLAPMLMWMKVLRSGSADEGLRARALDMLEVSLKAQMQLIDDLVDLTRSRTGKLRVDQRPLDLVPLVRAAVAAVGPFASDKQIDLRTVVEGPACRISGDTSRLQQVVANLLSNAIKFTPAGGRVVARVGARNEQAILSVEDTGEGIDAASIPRLFEPFRQQDDSPGRRHGGLGLGLAIVRQLVELHGGTVAAASPGRGRGATFTVTFPALPISAPAAVVFAEPRAITTPEQVLAGVRVLVVEDETNTREALTLTLEMHGAEVTSAASAAEGRAALARFAADLIVCDIAMPDEDGYTFVKQLRDEEARGGQQRLPVVALTAHATPEHRRRALEAGFTLHLTKPVDVDHLLSTLLAVAPPRRALPKNT